MSFLLGFPIFRGYVKLRGGTLEYAPRLPGDLGSSSKFGTPHLVGKIRQNTYGSSFRKRPKFPQNMCFFGTPPGRPIDLKLLSPLDGGIAWILDSSCWKPSRICRQRDRN